MDRLIDRGSKIGRESKVEIDRIDREIEIDRY